MFCFYSNQNKWFSVYKNKRYVKVAIFLGRWRSSCGKYTLHFDVSNCIRPEYVLLEFSFGESIGAHVKDIHLISYESYDTIHLFPNVFSFFFRNIIVVRSQINKCKPFQAADFQMIVFSVEVEAMAVAGWLSYFRF